MQAEWVKPHVTHGGTRIKTTSDFFSNIVQARREDSEIYKVLKGRKKPPT